MLGGRCCALSSFLPPSLNIQTCVRVKYQPMLGMHPRIPSHSLLWRSLHSRKRRANREASASRRRVQICMFGVCQQLTHPSHWFVRVRAAHTANTPTRSALPTPQKYSTGFEEQGVLLRPSPGGRRDRGVLRARLSPLLLAGILGKNSQSA